jgi:hypothetical protein
LVFIDFSKVRQRKCRAAIREGFPVEQFGIMPLMVGEESTVYQKDFREKTTRRGWGHEGM